MTPTIVGRWRALNESHLERLQNKEETGAAADVTAFMFTRVSAVIVIAGYHEGLPPKLAEEVLSNLRSITKRILELRSTIGGKSPFCDLKIVHHRTGTPFDPKWMDALLYQGDRARAEPVLCTTDLGLRRSRIIAGEKGVDYVDDILLMPKVLLQSTVEDVLEP